MSATFTTRTVTLAGARMNSREVAAELAHAAKAGVAEAMALGETVSNRVTRWVNGVQGAPEEFVKPPGPILYRFDLFAPRLLPALLEFLRRQSPVLSGRFRDSWFALQNGREIEPDRASD